MNTKKICRYQIAGAIGAGVGFIVLVGAGGLALASSIAPALSVAATSSSDSLTPVSQTISVETQTRSERSVSGALALCPAGQIPLLNIAAFPASDRGGSTTAAAAILVASPGVSISSLQPMGRSPQAPVWLVTERGTFVATTLRDGSWFAAPATLTGCHAP